MMRFRRSVSVVIASLACLCFETSHAGSTEGLIKKLRGRKAESAATQLADMGKEALADLSSALSDKRWKVRYWALYSVAYNKAAKDDGGLLEKVKGLLQDKRDDVRLRAAMALGRHGDKAGLSVGKDFSTHRKAPLRADAAFALGAVGGDEAVGLLKELVRDRAARVRAAAIFALRDAAKDDALKLALGSLSDGASEVRVAALDSIGALGKDNADALKAALSALKDKKPSVREMAARVLGSIGDKASLAPLRELRDKAREKGFVKSAAEVAIVRIQQRMKGGN